MKLPQLSTLARTCRAILIAAFAILGAGALKAANFFDDTVSGINLGNASGGTTGGHKSWAIFALSGGVTITDPSVDGSYDVLGNVGIAGLGNLTMSASKIQGDIWRDSGSQTLSGGANFTGTSTTGNGAYLSTGVSNANSASTTAGGLSATGGTVSTLALNNTPATNLSLGLPASGAAGTTYVLNLQDLVLSGANAILTLNGTSTTNYVVNVARYMTLSSSAKIQLSGGLTSANVLFNVQSSSPQYDVTLSGGSVVNGIILSPTRNVKLTGASVVYGEVIAKSVSLSGRSKVINPFVSP